MAYKIDFSQEVSLDTSLDCQGESMPTSSLWGREFQLGEKGEQGTQGFKIDTHVFLSDDVKECGSVSKRGDRRALAKETGGVWACPSPSFYLPYELLAEGKLRLYDTGPEPEENHSCDWGIKFLRGEATPVNAFLLNQRLSPEPGVSEVAQAEEVVRVHVTFKLRLNY